MNARPTVAISLLALLLLAAPAVAQDESDVNSWAKFVETIEWVRGPGTGEMPPHAALELPEGYIFTGTGHTQRLMTYFDNLLTDTEVGFVAEAAFLGETEDPSDWFIVFEFEDIGYVENAAEEELDADAMLEAMQEGDEEANRRRKEMGLATLSVVGWAKPPYYDPETRNIEWATRLQSGDGGIHVNHNIRILGRRGVMHVTLVTSPEALDANLVKVKGLLKGFGFQAGETYGDYRSGDRVWKYGLTGLVIGGGAVAALKTGFFAKIWKVLWKVLIVVGVGIAALFRRIVGGPKQKNYGEHRRRRRDESEDEAPPEA